MAGMKEVCHEIVRSYEQRQRSLNGLEAQTSQLLKAYRQDHQALRKELSEAKQAWQDTARSLKKKRTQRSK